MFSCRVFVVISLSIAFILLANSLNYNKFVPAAKRIRNKRANIGTTKKRNHQRKKERHRNHIVRIIQTWDLRNQGKARTKNFEITQNENEPKLKRICLCSMVNAHACMHICWANCNENQNLIHWHKHRQAHTCIRGHEKRQTNMKGKIYCIADANVPNTECILCFHSVKLTNLEQPTELLLCKENRHTRHGYYVLGTYIAIAHTSSMCRNSSHSN